MNNNLFGKKYFQALETIILGLLVIFLIIGVVLKIHDAIIAYRYASYPQKTITVEAKGSDLAEKTSKIFALADGKIITKGDNNCLIVDDTDKQMDLARKEALANASEKAQHLATMSGLNLGKLVNVSDSTFTAQYSPGNSYGGACATPIAPNTPFNSQELLSTVSATYKVK